jgi:anti-sigma-K factor RskA
MRHLTSEQLVDAAEGAPIESSSAHLETCEACQRRLTELQALRAAAADAGDVPEPSPLFWDHLSARVHDAVGAAGVPRAAWWRPSAWPWIAMPAAAGAVVAIVLAVVITLRLTPMPTQTPAPVPVHVALVEPAIDDGPLNLVADLAAQMDWDAVNEIGAPVHAGAADEAMSDLSAAERAELQRLLQELARPGA